MLSTVIPTSLYSTEGSKIKLLNSLKMWSGYLPWHMLTFSLAKLLTYLKPTALSSTQGLPSNTKDVVGKTDLSETKWFILCLMHVKKIPRKMDHIRRHKKNANHNVTCREQRGEVSLKREKLLRSRRFITPCRRFALCIGQTSCEQNWKGSKNYIE